VVRAIPHDASETADTFGLAVTDLDTAIRSEVGAIRSGQADEGQRSSM
jgi:hypothetical protein